MTPKRLLYPHLSTVDSAVLGLTPKTMDVLRALGGYTEQTVQISLLRHAANVLHAERSDIALICMCLKEKGGRKNLAVLKNEFTPTFRFVQGVHEWVGDMIKARVG